VTQEQEINGNKSLADKVKQLETEVEEWRKKFLHLNREYHTNQERLVMSLAELD
jgi:molecular chaperone GrpE (heat shock protein)